MWTATGQQQTKRRNSALRDEGYRPFCRPQQWGAGWQSGHKALCWGKRWWRQQKNHLDLSKCSVSSTGFASRQSFMALNFVFKGYYRNSYIKNILLFTVKRSVMSSDYSRQCRNALTPHRGFLLSCPPRLWSPQLRVTSDSFPGTGATAGPWRAHRGPPPLHPTP